VIKKFTDWILYTSVFAGLCAVALCVATERLITGFLPPGMSPLHVFIFGCTLVVYNAHFLLRKFSPNISDRYAWTARNSVWHYVVFLTGAIASGISIFFLPLDIWIACVVLGALSFTYTLPLLPFNKTRIRDLGWLKILTLTLVWTIVTSVLPLLYYEQSLLDYPFEILLRFVFMFVLCVAFDIRDMQTDRAREIFTLPNLIGAENSYKLINVGIVVFLVLSVVQHVRYPSVGRLAGAVIAAAATKGAIEYTKRHPSDKNYLGIVDGMMLLYGCLVAFFSHYK